MPDPEPNATTDPVSTPDPSTQAPTTVTTPPASTSSSSDSFSLADLKRELDGFGERMVSGIREAFPAPVVTTPPVKSDPDPDPKVEPPNPDPKVKTEVHPTPGEHGGGKLAAWWFGSKR